MDIRIDEYQQARHTVRESQMVQTTAEQEQQLRELTKQIEKIRSFQTHFTKKITDVLLNLSTILHQDPVPEREDVDFCQSIEKILRVQADILKMTREAGESKSRQDQIKHIIQDLSDQQNKLIEQVFPAYVACIQTLSNKTKQRVKNFIDSRKEYRKIFWKDLPKNLSIVLNFIDSEFVVNLFS